MFDAVGLEKEIEKEIEREQRRHKRLFRFFEFFVIGFLFGVVEDILVVLIATDAQITYHTVLIAAAIALPFAIFSELIFDHPKTRAYVRKRVFHSRHRKYSHHTSIRTKTRKKTQ